MILTGTIIEASQASEPSGQYNVRYQDITITDQQGNDHYGRIGSKQGYQVNTPISVTVETRPGETGEYNYFRKHNPQYADRTASPRSPQAPSQAAQQPEKENVDWDAKDRRQARMNGLNNATRLMVLLAEMNKQEISSNIIKKCAAEFVDYIYNGILPHENRSQDYKTKDGEPNF